MRFAATLRSLIAASALSLAVAASAASAQSNAAPFTYVPGSTTKVCQLTGVLNRTPTEEFGLIAADRGYSFSHNGKIWFLLGDAQPTAFFPQRGPHNATTDNKHNRWGPGSSTANLDNDAIAFAAQTAPGACPHLQFIPQKSPAVGAYTSPSLSYNGAPLPLRTNESPFSGIDVNGTMYVIFGTNNPNDTHTPETCRGEEDKFCLGSPLTTVLGKLNDEGTLRFSGLYVFSGPTPGDVSAPAGRFVQVAIATAGDGYLYFFGTTGGGQKPGAHPCGAVEECYRHSYVRLARLPLREIERASGGRPAAIEYWSEPPGAAGAWKTGDESAATPLFRDNPACMGEAGVEYNEYARQWIMLYNCLSGNPGGIQMRMAPAPQGPWSSPQTIFNAARDHGLCYFIHSRNGNDCPPDAPNPPARNPDAQTGGDYGPYFIAGWTRSSPADRSITFYYTLDTFVPYGQAILKTTIHS